MSGLVGLFESTSELEMGFGEVGIAGNQGLAEFDELGPVGCSGVGLAELLEAGKMVGLELEGLVVALNGAWNVTLLG